ncbi:hypothetical protein MWU78_11750 [Arenibacter sp. F26102]|uniref:Rieske (2Fe-2S) protein n=1 Tax=Arenibacter sp. F26102 TaxID=2926416 RepID=UPI001FF6338E|nr:hypothetical protein [Arenibacter sp. F26102]MCK0146320.1 hypothetical protein [Arenibacter sp. F26102]
MKPILGILLFFFLFSCEKNSTNRNPYLQEISFRFALNLNLPLYSPLTNTGSAVYVSNAAVGTKGAFVINTGFNSYMAWEASCPNHAPNECSTMSLDGQLVTCSCEGYEYHLFTGQLMNRPEDGRSYHDLLYYKATYSGNSVIISN